MKTRQLYIIITLICISLLGIIAVQYLWIRNAIRVKQELFDRSVNDALGKVADKLELTENLAFLAQSRRNDSILALIRSFGNESEPEMQSGSDLQTNQAGPAVKNSRKFVVPVQQQARVIKANDRRIFEQEKDREAMEKFLASKEHMRMTDSIFDRLQSMTVTMNPMTLDIEFQWDEKQMERLDSLMRIQQFYFEEQSYAFRLNRMPLEDDEIRIISSVPPAAPRKGSGKKTGKEDLLLERVDKLTVKAKKIQEIIRQLTMDLELRTRTLTDRIQTDTLRSYIIQALQEKKILLPFEFAVSEEASDTAAFPVASAGFRKELTSTRHKAMLFPNDLVGKPAHLLLYFPGQQNHVFKSVGMLMAGSILFTIIIVMTSVASIIVMIRQKKISDIKTDFINNMTHEFKTPIATISIATDSINNPKVLNEPRRITDFTRIIKEENNRMNARVEQVLQMALLDSRDFRLRKTSINMNELIRRASEHFRLLIEKREGTLTVETAASKTMVNADEDHMRNVVMNLLDNANKYSLVKPHVRIYSRNAGKKLIFGVEDNGIGMNADTQRRIFEKFFRVTTGNIHNIKGFGLGLSYVKAIVLAHQGEISLHSEIGKGSRFEIILPLDLTAEHDEHDKDESA